MRKNPFSGTWLQMVTVGGLVQDITRTEVVKMFLAFWVGAAAVTGLRTWENSGPILIRQHPAEVSEVEVHGTSVIIHIKLYEVRPSCSGSYVVRRMVRYADAALTKPAEIAFFQERDIPWGKVGTQDFLLHLNLFEPLHGDGWHFYYERTDNCGLLDDLFPHHPISAPPVPAVIKD
jgi:hypothetical protein